MAFSFGKEMSQLTNTITDMFYSTGTLRYYNDPIKLIVEVDPDISRFYYSLIPKYIHANKQMFAPHISVVRKEIPPNMTAWNKYGGHELDFEYDNYIYNDETYYWLNCYSKRLEEIRIELGLSSVSENHSFARWSPQVPYDNRQREKEMI